MLQSLPDDHTLQCFFRCWQIVLQKSAAAGGAVGHFADGWPALIRQP